MKNSAPVSREDTHTATKVPVLSLSLIHRHHCKPQYHILDCMNHSPPTAGEKKIPIPATNYPYFTFRAPHAETSR